MSDEKDEAEDSGDETPNEGGPEDAGTEPGDVPAGTAQALQDKVMDRQVAGMLLAGLVVAFAVGFGAADVVDTAPTADGELSPGEVEQRVVDYLDVVAGSQVNASVLDVSDSQVSGLYVVTLEVTAPTMNGSTQTQELEMYASKDGQFLFQPPQDLANPPQPQMQPAPQ